MNLKLSTKPLFLMCLLLFSFFAVFSVLPVQASPYYITHPTYFPSKSDSYITFDSSLLPVSFNTLYRNTQTRWRFNNYWVTSTVDMTITAWFTDNWLNYTINGASTQEIYTASEPTNVYFNDAQQTKGDTWSYSNGVVTTTPSGTDVALFFGSGVIPRTLLLFLRDNYYTALILISLLPLVFGASVVVRAVKRQEDANSKEIMFTVSLGIAVFVAFIVVIAIMDAVIGT